MFNFEVFETSEVMKGGSNQFDITVLVQHLQCKPGRLRAWGDNNGSIILVELTVVKFGASEDE